MSEGRVYLVGAGCGGADMITLRGMRLLQTCDVVVYDDLLSPDLLAAAPQAEHRYMGKRGGRCSARQEDISALLVEEAKQGKTVVRLKGGDPFVFGRGGEEVLALQAAGIGYEVVSGVSSAVCIPAAAGIPVTHRRVSRSFHVITGHTADSAAGLPAHLERLAGLEGTLVFLMGLGQLENIAAGLLEGGKSPETPAAVISGAVEPPKAVRAPLRDIAQQVKAAGLVSPAVIVVGETAAMDLSSTLRRPLAGVTVGLTGTAAVTEKLRRELTALGARTVEAERSVVEETGAPIPWEALLDGGAHWLVFTSANGVDIFFRHLVETGADLRRLGGSKIAVIGGATGQALRRWGACPDLCPKTWTSEGLARELLPMVAPGEDVYLLRSADGAPVLPRVLGEAGVPCEDVPLYRLRPCLPTSQESAPLLETMDYLVFSSGSGTRLYHQLQGAVPEGCTCVCIGDVTGRALEAWYHRPYLTARETSAAGIAQVILEHRAGSGEEKGEST